jgi:fermentation-respiration switch protein FrsA (DUF1100 family)
VKPVGLVVRSTPITAAIVGRIAVWTASQAWSTYGILSVTNSTA